MFLIFKSLSEASLILLLLLLFLSLLLLLLLSLRYGGGEDEKRGNSSPSECSLEGDRDGDDFFFSPFLPAVSLAFTISLNGSKSPGPSILPP